MLRLICPLVQCYNVTISRDIRNWQWFSSSIKKPKGSPERNTKFNFGFGITSLAYIVIRHLAKNAPYFKGHIPGGEECFNWICGMIFILVLPNCVVVIFTTMHKSNISCLPVDDK